MTGEDCRSVRFIPPSEIATSRRESHSLSTRRCDVFVRVKSGYQARRFALTCTRSNQE
jgi:hypothetical protein